MLARRWPPPSAAASATRFFLEGGLPLRFAYRGWDGAYVGLGGHAAVAVNRVAVLRLEPINLVLKRSIEIVPFVHGRGYFGDDEHNFGSRLDSAQVLLVFPYHERHSVSASRRPNAGTPGRGIVEALDDAGARFERAARPPHRRELSSFRRARDIVRRQLCISLA